jgi:glycosyltransferase involved in cell wall biosynthesis
MPARVTLAVVMPAYNEQDAIQDAVDDVRTHILDVIPGSSLLVVDDGSRDNTGALLDRLAADDSRVSVLHKRNGGHGPAIVAGISASFSDYVFLLDSDRQIPLDHFSDAWRLVLAGKDGVFGVRRHRDDPTLRLVLTAVIRQSIRLLFGVRLYDSNVPYKLLRRSAWEEAKPHIPPDTLAPSLFLAIFMKRRGMDIAELEISHRERQTGEVSIKRWKLVKFCARGFRQLLAFRAGVLAG